MITRMYKKACEHCGANGYIYHPGISASIYETCPVCDGTKVIVVTETITEPESKMIVNKDILTT